MSQPHPPIPEPQPHADADDPRTQSILLPPSQRPGEPAEQPAAEPAPVPVPAEQFTEPRYDDPRYGSAGPTQVTGPVDFVPGFGGDVPRGSSAATAPPSPGPTTSPGTPPPPSGPRRSPFAAVQRAGRGSTALVSLGLGVLALLLLQLGLVPDHGTESLWDVVPTWSTFATVATLVVLLPAVAGLTGRLPVRVAWQAGAAGLAALAATWVLVALPLAASDRGFWLTAAVASAGAALWLAPGRDR
jgi:hypothetical protein